MHPLSGLVPLPNGLFMAYKLVNTDPPSSTVVCRCGTPLKPNSNHRNSAKKRSPAGDLVQMKLVAIWWSFSGGIQRCLAFNFDIRKLWDCLILADFMVLRSRIFHGFEEDLWLTHKFDDRQYE